MRVIEAAAVISAKDKTGGTFANIARKMGLVTRASRQVNSASRAMNSALANSLGILARYAGPAAIGGAALASAKWAAALETAITDLGVTTDATNEQIAKASETLRKFAPEVGKTAEETVEITRILAAAGMQFNEAVAATPKIAKAAVATSSAFGDMATAGYAAMEQLGIGVNDLDAALEKMAIGGKLGRFEVRDMAREFPALAASANKLGFVGVKGVSELTAMLEIVRKTAGTSEEAANNLNDALQKVFAPQTVRNFEKKGVQIGKVLEEAAGRGENGFLAVIDTLKTMTKDLTDTARSQLIAELFPDKQARAGIDALLRYREAFGDMFREIMKTSGVIDRDLGRRLDTTAGKWDKMTAAIDRAAVSMGNSLSPAIGRTADNLKAMIDDIEARDGGLLSDLINLASKDTGDIHQGPLGSISINGKEVINFDDLVFGKTPDKVRQERVDQIASDEATAREQEKRMAALAVAAENTNLPHGDPTAPRRIAEYHRLSDKAAATAADKRRLLGPIAARDMAGVDEGKAFAAQEIAEGLKKIQSEEAAAAREFAERYRFDLPFRLAEPGVQQAMKAQPIDAETISLIQKVSAPVPDVHPFTEVASEAQDAATSVEAAFAHLDLASAAEQSGESYRAALAAAGSGILSEAQRIMRELERVMSRPIRPNIQMPSARSGPGSVGQTMEDVMP